VSCPSSPRETAPKAAEVVNKAAATLSDELVEVVGELTAVEQLQSRPAARIAI
jgi:hypothetical protein